MSDLWAAVQNKEVEPIVAMSVSDLHLSSKAPVARSAEPDWFEAQKRPLLELSSVWDRLGSPPILYAGDLFDRHNPSPELINFALNYVPHGYAVPGNHDLPYHDYEQVKKSAYWTLVEAEVIDTLPPDDYVMVPEPRLNIYGFPHGFQVGKRVIPKEGLNVAVIHQYVWQSGKDKHHGAESDSHIAGLIKRLKMYGYDCAVVGDNHHPFIHRNQGKDKDRYIMNCGAFIRRKMDERHLRPMIGLIHADGSITPYYLDTSEDKWIDVEDSKYMEETDREVIEELLKMADVSINFQEAVKRYVANNQVSKPVREIILDAIQEM